MSRHHQDKVGNACFRNNDNTTKAAVTVKTKDLQGRQVSDVRALPPPGLLTAGVAGAVVSWAV